MAIFRKPLLFGFGLPVLLAPLQPCLSLCVMYSCIKTIYEGMEDFRCENYPYDQCLSATDCGGHCDNIPDHACSDNRECLIPAPTPHPVAAPMPTGSICWWASQADAQQCERLGGGTGVCYGSQRACFSAGGGEYLGGLCGHGGNCGCCLGWPTPPPVPYPTLHPDARPTRHPWPGPTPKPTHPPHFEPTPKPTWWPTPQPTMHPSPQPTDCCPQFALSAREISDIVFAVYMCVNVAIILYFRWIFTRKERLRLERFYAENPFDEDEWDDVEEGEVGNGEVTDEEQQRVLEDIITMSAEEKQRVLNDPSHPYHKYLPPARKRERSNSEQSFDRWVNQAVERRRDPGVSEERGKKQGILKKRSADDQRRAQTVSVDRVDGYGGDSSAAPPRNFHGAMGGRHHAMSLPRLDRETTGHGTNNDDAMSAATGRSVKSRSTGVAFDMGEDEGYSKQQQQRSGSVPREAAGREDHRRARQWRNENKFESERPPALTRHDARGGKKDGTEMVAVRDPTWGIDGYVRYVRKSSFDSTEGETESLDGAESLTSSQELEMRRARRQRAVDICCDDCCADFEWWSCGAWVGWAIRLFIEAIVFPIVLLYLLYRWAERQSHRRKVLLGLISEGETSSDESESESEDDDEGGSRHDSQDPKPRDRPKAKQHGSDSRGVGDGYEEDGDSSEDEEAHDSGLLPGPSRTDGSSKKRKTRKPASERDKDYGVDDDLAIVEREIDAFVGTYLRRFSVVANKGGASGLDHPTVQETRRRQREARTVREEARRTSIQSKYPMHLLKDKEHRRGSKNSTGAGSKRSLGSIPDDGETADLLKREGSQTRQHLRHHRSSRGIDRTGNNVTAIPNQGKLQSAPKE